MFVRLPQKNKVIIIIELHSQLKKNIYINILTTEASTGINIKKCEMNHTVSKWLL